jgi:hypothetical protein
MHTGQLTRRSLIAGRALPNRPIPATAKAISSPAPGCRPEQAISLNGNCLVYSPTASSLCTAWLSILRRQRANDNPKGVILPDAVLRCIRHHWPALPGIGRHIRRGSGAGSLGVVTGEWGRSRRQGVAPHGRANRPFGLAESSRWSWRSPAAAAWSGPITNRPPSRSPTTTSRPTSLRSTPSASNTSSGGGYLRTRC